ncbi:MAG: hypothetical protein RXR82_06005, partial [Nitrososphaeria archaeon]
WADPSAANQNYYIGHFAVNAPNGNNTIWVIYLTQNETAANGILESIILNHAAPNGLALDGNDDTILIDVEINASNNLGTDLAWNIPNGSGLMIGGYLSDGANITAKEFTFVRTNIDKLRPLSLAPISGQNAIYNFFGVWWVNPAQINVPYNSNTTNTVYINFIGCLINTSGAALPNPFFYNSNSSSGSVSIYAKFINSLLQSSSAASLFGSGIDGYAEFDDLTQPLTNVNVNNAAVSTPAVPSSGTAQANTNPFPVLVFLSGGSATEVQITKGGNTYTIWSSSSAAAIPFMSVRLNPGDSITITYSSAPTWVWTPA